MRTLCTAFGILAALLATSARADDTKPPAISDVKATPKGGSVTIEARITDETGVLSATCFHRKAGGKFEETSMVKNEYDDNFKVTFAGGPDLEYYIQATDLLGNGPSSYGAAAKPMALGSSGGKGKAERPPPPDNATAAEEKPKREAPPPPPQKTSASEDKPKHGGAAGRRTAKAPSAKPVVEHRKPNTAIPDGQAFTLRIRIKSDTPISAAALYARPAGSEGLKAPIPLKNTEGEAWEVTIPENLAHGALEYVIAAKDSEGLQTNQGDGPPGDSRTWYKITYKAPVGSAAEAKPVDQPFAIAHAPPLRFEPGRPIVLRAQVSPPGEGDLDDAQAADAEQLISTVTARILFRGQDAVDQVTDMEADPSGGLGGFRAELPLAPPGSVIYYQVVACDAAGEKCAIDTASKKKWHALTVSKTPAARPAPISAVSSKAPPSLPE